jgi:glycosyltransferase involved in cell wall biosynthesis
MPRVLLIANSFPPSEFIAAVRPGALAKYLPQFGWEVVVLTPRTKGVSRPSKFVIETENRNVLEDWKARLGMDQKKGIHEQFGLAVAKKPGYALPHTRALNFVRYLVTYPHPYKGWIPFALEAIAEIRRQNRDISAIVTTCPPITCHLIGRQAKSILGCPWIADFRDLWTQNLGDGGPHFLQGGLEKRTLKYADVLVTVSDPWADRLQSRYPNKKICTIPNGFDPDDYSSPAPPLTRDFTISYTGQLYEDQRDPTALFEVLRDLLKEGSISADDLRVRFYGSLEAWLPALIKKCGLEAVAELHGPTPRKEVMVHQRESQVLLVLPWSDPRETGHHSAKLFEYFAAARPILAVGGSRGVLTEALEETYAGVHALSKALLREFLLKAYAEYKKCGCVAYAGKRQAIERYSHPEMARSFAQVLDSTLQEAQSERASGCPSSTSRKGVEISEVGRRGF